MQHQYLWNILCWPCYHVGFRSQNPEASANNDEGEEGREGDTRCRPRWSRREYQYL